MKTKFRVIAGVLAMSIFGVANAALDATDQRYVDRLVTGGPDTLHDVSESLFNSGTTNPEVLDVAAEVLLQKYTRTEGSFGLNDAMAYLCKALGASGNARYKPVVEKVADGAENRKLRSHCSKAAKSFPKKTDVPGYVQGTVDLEKLRNAAMAPTKPSAAPAAQARAKGSGKVDFSLIREGMSSQEVEDILGPPTATSSHATGKQWQPFNYGARDLQRMKFLYKGVGHIEFSLKSAYEGVFRVIAVVPDPNETGYP